MSESTKATIEILEHYHHNGGFYEIPVEVINTVEQELEEQDKEIERLNNIINELEEYLIEQVEKSYSNDYDNVLDKLDELKESNEQSFEEMVGFVENVCKDIKNQSTLPEELEEERKTIAKIVDDFKEVNK